MRAAWIMITAARFPPPLTRQITNLNGQAPEARSGFDLIVVD